VIQASLEDSPLPAAPPSPVGDDGQPRFGAYVGTTELSWARLEGRWARNPVWRLLHAKRWHYVSIAGPRVVAAILVVDIGWAANAFVYVFDREERALRADLSLMGVPGLMAKVADRAGDGACTTFTGGGALLKLEQRGAPGAWHVLARGPGGLSLEADLEPPAAPTLCAIAKIDGGVANCTHKTAGLPARGRAIAGGREYDLDGHTAAFDHTYGLLARDTTWRWASAARPDLALNLVQGFNGAVENVVWHGGKVHPVGEAEIRYDAGSTLGPWRVRTRDGSVDLTFHPEGERRQDKNLVVAVSRYVQPIGVFSGTIRLPGVELAVADLVGVTEDHTARW
jgi:hypothetical protein